MFLKKLKNLLGITTSNANTFRVQANNSIMYGYVWIENYFNEEINQRKLCNETLSKYLLLLII